MTGLKLNRVYRGPGKVASFGRVQKLVLESPEADDCYFAFATARGSAPEVFAYGTDEQGLAELSNLIRSDEVLAVVRGQRVVFRQSSVVELSVGREQVEHRLRVDEVI